MKPKILLLDEPHPKARELMESVAELQKCTVGKEINPIKKASFETNITKQNVVAIYTQFTPISAIVPVFCPCTGIDHIKAPKVIFLDDEWKRTEGQQVTSTAEHTWSLILQLAKINRMQLREKTLGIIGCGRIGEMVGFMAPGFMVEILFYDKYVPEKSWLPYRRTLEYVLQNSDIITLHVPLNDETRVMIGKKEFELMKQGALLVNTSRAEIVNQQELLYALDNKLNGYAHDFSDTHFMEEYKKNPRKVALVQTPHIAGNCKEAREMTDIYIAKQIVKYIKEELSR